jgi:hypothetical protein
MDGRHNMTSGFPLYAFCYMCLQSPLACVNQLTVLVTINGYRMHVNGKTRELERNIGKYAGERSREKHNS